MKSILLVDDNDSDNEFHEIVIKETSIAETVKSIPDSRKALEYLQQCFATNGGGDYSLPELIFLDINMPALNGFEFLEKLREMTVPADMKKKFRIFMLTGSLNPDDRETAITKYADLVSGFYIKPLTDTVFLKIIKENF